MTKGIQEVWRFKEELDKDDVCLWFFLTYTDLYSEHLTKEVLEGFEDLKVGGQVSCTVKCAYDFVPLAKEETVLSSMTVRLIKIGRCYGMQMNVETTKVLRISRQPSPIQIMIDQKQLKNVEYSSYLGSVMINNIRCTCEIISRITMEKQYSTIWRLFQQQTELKFREETTQMLHWGHSYVWRWTLVTSGRRSEIPSKIWKVVLEKDGEDQLEPAMWKMKQYYTESKRKGISYIE